MKRNWTVAYYSSQDGAGGTSHYAIKDGSRTVARTPGQVATERDEEDIRLAAAAPELLEALRMFVSLDPRCHHGVEHCGECAACLGQAAIAKAEGATS